MTQRGAVLVTMSEHHRDDGTLVRLSGRLDRRSVADVRLALQRLVSTTDGPVLLDLDEAVLGDASAVGVLVELRGLARRSGVELRVVAADDRTTRLLHRARLHGILAPSLRGVTPLRPAAGLRLAGAV